MNENQHTDSCSMFAWLKLWNENGGRTFFQNIHKLLSDHMALPTQKTVCFTVTAMGTLNLSSGTKVIIDIYLNSCLVCDDIHWVSQTQNSIKQNQILLELTWSKTVHVHEIVSRNINSYTSLNDIHYIS
jgi:hypothetical protein